MEEARGSKVKDLSARSEQQQDPISLETDLCVPVSMSLSSRLFRLIGDKRDHRTGSSSSSYSDNEEEQQHDQSQTLSQGEGPQPKSEKRASTNGLGKSSLFLLLLLSLLNLTAATRESYYVHWNTSNPIFRIDNTDHIIDVNRGNQPWEYDQVNIVCPMYAPGTRPADIETYIIYSVTKDEYDSCRITDPHPRVIAQCNNPHRLMYFTITFRSFTPTPGGMEFQPGRDYYFISTSTNGDLHRRVGGKCSTHNMKIQFKVADNRHEAGQGHHAHRPSVPGRAPPSPNGNKVVNRPREDQQVNGRNRPLDVNRRGYPLSGNKKLPMYYGDLGYFDGQAERDGRNNRDKKHKEYEVHPNEIIKHEASRMASAAAASAPSGGNATANCGAKGGLVFALASVAFVLAGSTWSWCL